jgi:hypothetical protein
MKSQEPYPPRWAEALLRSLLRPADRESISGDLLEEYRETRRPALGALGADVWYVKHAASMLWYLIRPYALALVGPSLVLALTVFRPGHHAVHQSRDTPALLSWIIGGLWYGSIAPTPGVSLLDAFIYLAIGCHGFHRTRLIKTAALAAAATSFFGMIVLFAAAATITPGLVGAIFVNPLLLVIVSVYLLIPVGYAALLGALAGSIERWLQPGALIRRLNLNSIHFG